MKNLCGTDIIEINRIKDAIQKLGDSFKHRIYTGEEIEYCEQKGEQKYQHYAARFAAKEAVFKAISVLLDNKYQISWKDINIYQDINHKPKVKLQQVSLNKIKDIDISMSHCKEYAIAMAIIVTEE